MRLILASASPRRAELLAAAGYNFEVLSVTIDERVGEGERARDYVLRLAAEKSAAALASVTDALVKRRSDNASAHMREQQAAGPKDIVVLGADTAVAVGEQILGKPDNDEHAIEMLRQLSARAHQVFTGVSIRTATRAMAAVEVTTVWFAPLSTNDIQWYVASGETTDKAGAYAIQGLASRFIPRIEGSYSNVVGLPIATVHHLLQQLTSRSMPSFLASQ